MDVVAGRVRLDDANLAEAAVRSTTTASEVQSSRRETGDHEASCGQERSIGAHDRIPGRTLFEISRVGAAAADWPFSPGVAGRGFRGAVASLARRGEFVDDKWERAAGQANLVRAGFARLLGDVPANIALGQNTHELVVRWLSALPFRQRTRSSRLTVSSTHCGVSSIDSLRHARGRNVAARPADTLADRLATALDDRTAGGDGVVRDVRDRRDRPAPPSGGSRVRNVTARSCSSTPTII